MRYLCVSYSFRPQPLDDLHVSILLITACDYLVHFNKFYFKNQLMNVRHKFPYNKIYSRLVL